jgi:diguanylate cyclase (GGDEF)-like protein
MKRTEQTNFFNDLMIALFMALLYNITGMISTTLLSQTSIVVVSAFIPEGVALAGALIYGYKVLPGIFIGQLLLAQFAWSNSLAAIGVAFINTFEAYIAYKIFYKLELNRELKQLRDIIGLVLIITLILQPISAIFGNYILAFTSVISFDDIWHNAILWWTGNVMGQILIAPMLLLIYAHKQEIKLHYVLLAIIAPLVYVYILQTYFTINNISLLLLLTLPVSIYMAIKNLTYAMLVSVSISIGYTYLTHLDIGTFAQDQSPIDNIIHLNFFILNHILLVLIIGILFKDKEHAINELKSMAHYDYLTGLPNRHLLREKIQHAVIMAKDYHQKSAICYIDLDGFKDVNDVYGHHIGDETLKTVVSRIKLYMKPSDTLLRIGGDEFLLIVSEIRDDELDETLNELLESVRKPMHIDNKTISISFSVGVSICPKHGSTVKELMSVADNAMYVAKEKGKNQIHYA